MIQYYYYSGSKSSYRNLLQVEKLSGSFVLWKSWQALNLAILPKNDKIKLKRPSYLKTTQKL